MDTLTTNVIEQFKEKIAESMSKTTAKKSDVLVRYEFQEQDEEQVIEAHNRVVSTALPRNTKNIPASVLLMDDGTLDVKLPIGLTKSQRNKVIDMNTKEQGKMKIVAKLKKKLEERKKV